MASDWQYMTEIERLHKTGAESRLRAIESQLALAFTLCAIAETEIRYSRPDEATKVVKKIRHHAETIRTHVNEPNHIPRPSISDFLKQLTQLEKCTEEIELRLR